MKLFIASIILLLTSCTNTANEKIHSQTVTAVQLTNQVFNFVQTSDSKFCNPDSVMETDCGFGTLYLTEKGNAIYHYYCLGDDTNVYCIGTYLLTDSSIVCNYTQDYLYANCSICEVEDPGRKKANPNTGVLRSAPHTQITLLKSNCKNFEYYLPPTKEQRADTKRELEQARLIGYTLAPFRGYVFSNASDNVSDSITSFIRQIAALKDL